MAKLAAGFCLTIIALYMALGSQQVRAQDSAPSLEQRQPLEFVYADSIVPQDRHELMLTTGAWYSKMGQPHDAFLTQKVEWGLSNQLQISTLVDVAHSSNRSGSTATGIGDFEIGARYTWASVRSPFTHLALAIDAGFPTGDPARSLGEGIYTVSPSLLVSHEFRAGKYHLFSTSGLDFAVGHRALNLSQGDPLHHALFVNSGVSRHTGRGWAVAELSLDTNRWNNGDDTRLTFTPEYVWRAARRTELLLAIPIGLTSSADDLGVVFKFTFELGGAPE